MITAQDINTLRQQTGVGIMDCKKALVEAAGDFEKAIEILRKNGQKVSAARASKEASEGNVLTITNNAHTYGVVIALSCETDFVANSVPFQELGTTLLNTALQQQPSTREQLLQCHTEGGRSVQESITALIGTVGEKVTLSTYDFIQDETVVAYTHTGNNLGVLMGLQGMNDAQSIAAVRDVAMHVAAMNPMAIDQTGISEETMEKERLIALEQARNEGKPATMLEKIAQGKLHKFLKEHTLLSQSFVKDATQTVGQYLRHIAPHLTVNSFKRIAIKK